VTLERRHDGAGTLSLADKSWSLAVRALGAGRHDLRLGDRRLRLTVYAVGDKVAVFAPEGSALVTEVDLIAHAGETADDGGSLTAPMPGKVVALLAQAGDTVSRGQPVAVMEAMKMEHTLAAPRDGVVEAVLYAVGDQVAEGAALLRLRAA